MSCASIEVSSDDHLPRNICTACEEILEIAYNFRMRCENNDSILRKLQSSRRYMYGKSFPISTNDKESNEEEMCEEADKVTSRKLKVEHQEIKEEEEEEQREEKSRERSVAPEQCGKLGENCPVCGNAFESFLEVLHHMKEHNDAGDFILTCSLCSAIFTTAKSMMEHVSQHGMSTDEEWSNKLIGCSQCELCFLSAEEARVHEEAHRAEKDRQEAAETSTQQDRTNSANGYLCNICGKILKSKDRFQSHRNTHEGLRPHICLKCGRGFADRKNMHQHYDIVHLRKANHECPICHKKFYAPTKMKSHITMHYGVKPFACDICNKTFRLRMNMIKHKKTHSNERPHKCDKCSAAFIDKNLLTRHSYVHGGVRPYVCPLCGHRFTLKFSLKKHLGSGRCNGRNRARKPDCGGLVAEEWTEVANPQADACKYGGIGFGPKRESDAVAVNVLPDYEEDKE